MKPTLTALEKKQIPHFLSLMKEYYAYDGLVYTEKNARLALEELLFHESLGRAWFITLDGEIAGYAILAFGFCVEFHGKTAVVDELFLTESFRGKGLGPKILERLEAFCRKSGVKVMRLEVETSNGPALKVYTKFGFRRHERFLLSHILGRVDN